MEISSQAPPWYRWRDAAAYSYAAIRRIIAGGILPQEVKSLPEQLQREVDAVQLRLAETADAERLMDLINSAFRQAESFIIDHDRIHLEAVQSLLAKGEFLVAEDGSALAGCVYLELRGERAYLGLLSVDPARQKAGVGSMLMREAEVHCARAGCRFMDLRIIDLRKDNQAFYKRRGYVETGTEPFPSDLDTKLPCHFVNMSKPLV